MELALIIAGTICWIIGAWAALKLDAVLTGNPTDFHPVFICIALATWPLAIIYLATCKHHVNNGCNDYWDY